MHADKGAPERAVAAPHDERDTKAVCESNEVQPRRRGGIDAAHMLVAAPAREGVEGAAAAPTQCDRLRSRNHGLSRKAVRAATW